MISCANVTGPCFGTTAIGDDLFFIRCANMSLENSPKRTKH